MADVLKSLKEIVTILKRTNENKATLTVMECAEFINISKEKIRELVNKQNTDFPFFKVGAKVLINKSMLEAWLERIAKEHREL